MSTPAGLSLTPSGRLVLAAPTADSLSRAFALGSGRGLLELGLIDLPAGASAEVAYFHELARLFVVRLAATPDLEEKRERVEVPPPPEELAWRALSGPPMVGGEYLSEPVLQGLWAETLDAFREVISGEKGTVAEWIARKSPSLAAVGRVHFHLAENRSGPAMPFAFLATYTAGISSNGRPRHVPLARALEDGAKDRHGLLSLLAPVRRAAEKSPYVASLLHSRALFSPLAFSAEDAYRLLKELPALEESGVVVRVPDFWKSRRPPRPQATVKLGQKSPSAVGIDALLDFQVALTLDGEPMSEAEMRELAARSHGLALVKGRWVELDPQRLQRVLESFHEAKRAQREGLDFLSALRMLSGADLAGSAESTGSSDSGTQVTAGEWLTRTLASLREPGSGRVPHPIPGLVAELRPYQRAGVAWLDALGRLGMGGCLADDMGLGKTLQVLALLTWRKAQGERVPSLLVAPASLLSNWRAEAEKFSPALRTYLAHPSSTSPPKAQEAPDLSGVDLVITSYGSVTRYGWLSDQRFALVILDEAQAIKNPGAQQTKAVKALRGRCRLALTGTPVENRLADLYSIFDFLSPGLLGTKAGFARFVKRLSRDGGHADYGPLRELIRPWILRRLKTDPKVIADLPEKTEVKVLCGLTKEQAVLYRDSVRELEERLESADGMSRKGLILAFLLRFKQICNHPSQWLGDGGYEAKESGKLRRLGEICEEIASRQQKVLVFTQFREMTGPLSSFLARSFGRPGLVLHGATAVGKRRELVDAFQSEGGPPFFVLSLKAGGTGLNLTAASHVIHFDRWWNPAVEDQATDRAFRIGQKRNVLVHKLVCRGTVEERIDRLIETKKSLARELLGQGGEVLLTEMTNEEVLKLVTLDARTALMEAEG